MAEYVCPSCGKNERISQRSLAVVEWVGEFVSLDGQGFKGYEHETDQARASVVEELSFVPTYLFKCLKCNFSFNEAITDKEFKQRTKRNKT
jgi:hypothetical protein